MKTCGRYPQRSAGLDIAARLAADMPRIVVAFGVKMDNEEVLSIMLLGNIKSRG